MGDWSTYWVFPVASFGVFCTLLTLLTSLKKSTQSYPPGPPARSWLTGNLSEVPKESSWLRFTEWAKIYGDIISFRILDKRFVVINSVEVAYDLLDKRSIIYSGRMPVPILPLYFALIDSALTPQYINIRMGWDWIVAVLPYNDKWKARRRSLQHYFNQDASRKYEEVQTQKTHDLLANLLSTPEEFLSHIRHASGAVIMSIAYDHEIAPQNDHFVELAKIALANVSRGVSFGAQLVNVFPFLRFVPEWFPGNSWTELCRESTVVSKKMRHDPVQMVMKRMTTGKIRPCIATELLERRQSSDQLGEIEEICGDIYIGGADTTVAQIEGFFYAMVNHQDVQIKAQAEIDAVIGRERLPNFGDRVLLPYVEAVCREALRWCCVLPVGVPHHTIENDVYRGYFIPKGTTVIPNAWAMTRDESRYKNPDKFDPSRFLDSEGRLNDDDVGYAFGFGRRVCAGQYFARSTIWITVASVLASFNICLAKMESGDDIPVNSGFGGGVIMHTLPFKCAVMPRSELARRLIEDSVSSRD